MVEYEPGKYGGTSTFFPENWDNSYFPKRNQSMNYWFSKHEYLDPRDRQRKISPILNIADSEKYGEFFVDEIVNLSRNREYLNEIVFTLKQLLNDELARYDGFGFELYMIECDKEEARVKNVFEDDRVEAVIPTIDIFKFLQDCEEFLDKNNLEITQ